MNGSKKVQLVIGVLLVIVGVVLIIAIYMGVRNFWSYVSAVCDFTMAGLSLRSAFRR